MLLCCILGAACKGRTASGRIPIPQDTMQILMWEMFEADAYNETRSALDTNYRHDTAYASLYTDIFRTHHVTRSDFNDSYTYYMGQPDVLRKMVDSLVEMKSRALRQGSPTGTPGHPAPYRGNQPLGHPTPPVNPPGGHPPGGHPPGGFSPPGGFHPPGMPQRPGTMPPGTRPGLKPGARPVTPPPKPKPGPKTPTGKPADL